MVDGLRPASRAIDSIERPSWSLDASHSASMRMRTLVRVSDGSAQAVADAVEDLLALGGEVADVLVALGAGGGDAAVEVVEVELQGLELELRGRGLELAGADHELGDEPGQGLVSRGQLARRGAQAAA